MESRGKIFGTLSILKTEDRRKGEGGRGLLDTGGAGERKEDRALARVEVIYYV